MFFQKNRVEEDLRRIREANLPAATIQAEAKAQQRSKSREAMDHIGLQDIAAMVIAIFSLILPYVIAFVGIMAAVVLGFYWWML